MIQIACYKAQKFCKIPISISSQKKTYSEADSDVKRLILEIAQKFNQDGALRNFATLSFMRSHLPRVDRYNFGGKTKVAIASFNIRCPLEIKPRVEKELKKIAHKHKGGFVKKKHGPL